MTSRDLVNRVQRRLRREMNDRKLKVGHTGTLDPLAEGLVVLAVGAAARLTPWVLQHAKSYTARFRLGQSSPSGDLEEAVTEMPGAPVPTRSQIEAAVTAQTGWIDQIPPGHSAIWVGGERAHERVRRGETVDMPVRRVRIDRIEILEYRYPDLLIDVCCGSGTYLRSLGMDLAADVGTVAVMTELRRTRIGDFHVVDAACDVPPNDPPPSDPANLLIGLTPMPNPDGGRGSVWLTESIVPPIEGLRHMPQLDLSPQQVIDARHGLPVLGTPEAPIPGAPIPEAPIPEAPSPKDAVGVDASGQLVAILRAKKGRWAPYRVFPPHEWIKMP